MSRTITNKDCKLYHTKYCDMLNMQSCDACFVNERKNYDDVISDLDVLEELLPEEGIHSQFDGDECVLCRGDEKGKKEYYALLDLGHPEPKRTKRSAIGIKVTSKTGSMVPVQLSTCKACRRRVLILDYLPVLLPVLAGLITLLILLIPDVSDWMEQFSMLMPFAFFAVVVLLAMVVAAALKRALRMRFQAKMHLDPFEIPLLEKMRHKGWFPLSTSGTAIRFVFTKKRMRQGVCTGTPADATAEFAPSNDA